MDLLCLGVVFVVVVFWSGYEYGRIAQLKALAKRGE